MGAVIRIAPIFVADDAEQGVKSWRVVLHDMPDLLGTEKQVKWAVNIRKDSLHAFIDTMLQQGGDSAIAHRHWWTPELQQDVRGVQRALNDELVPMIRRATHSRDWINALDWHRKLHDAGIVARLLAEDKAGA